MKATLSRSESRSRIARPRIGPIGDNEAEKVNRVARDILKVYGQSIQEVAVTLNQILRGKTAYSDGWEVDRPWLSSLFWKAETLMQFRFSKIKMIMTSRQMRRWHYMKDEILRETDGNRHHASLEQL